ncbi:MAG TPA: hypothetical protein VN687_08330 [Blastocatellia bacterium]|nr:hypothetical protein [Blastocatellia bacterium]
MGQQKEIEAQSAAGQLGQELAKAGWRIAVYSSDPLGIDPYVVTGFVGAGVLRERSIVCYYPQEKAVEFPEMHDHRELFDLRVDASADWEGPFYRSISRVDGIVLIGGGAATLIAGHVALTRDLPIIALAHFEGSARQIWRQHLSAKPAFVQDDDLQIMGTWDPNDSPSECVKSLNRQLERSRAKQQAKENEYLAMQVKAKLWDKHVDRQRGEKVKALLAGTFFTLFVLCFLIGLRITEQSFLYSAVTILGLCFAGGSGATCRMLIPGAPISRTGHAPILGTIAGLVFTLLYLGPLQASSFIIPATDTSISSTTKSQYATSLVVAFLAGLGFDFAFQQLLRRSKDTGEEITRAAKPQDKPTA